MALIDNLILEGWLKTPHIIEAFKKIQRVDFLPASLSQGGPEEMKELAELNEALPIGEGQTISQPLVVAFMLELLAPKEGERILDVGFGSGWTTALLAESVGEKGKVVAIEVVPELKEFGENNIRKYNFIEKGRVECVLGDGSKGYPREAPYDKILVSASLAVAKGRKEDLSSLSTARELPKSWREQVKVGGRIVTPIGTSIWQFTKKSRGRGDEPSVHLDSALKDFVFEEKEYPGFVFVPLIEE